MSDAQLADSDRAFLGLGIQIDASMTIEEQLENAGLMWDAHVSNLAYSTAWGGLEDCDEIPVISRSDTGEFLTLGGREWKPYSNRLFIEDFNLFCKKADFVIERAGTITRGVGRLKETVAFASARIPHKRGGLVKVKGDPLELRVIFLNSFSYGKGIGAFLLTHRLFCQNQLRLSGRDRKTNILQHISSHLEGEKGRIKIKETLQELQKIHADYVASIDILADTSVSLDKAVDFFVNTMGENKKPLDKQPIQVKKMIDIYKGEYDNLPVDGVNLAMREKSTRGTAYGLLQAVSAYENHFTGDDLPLQAHLLDMWTGDAQKASTKAYEALSRLYVPVSKKNQVIQTVKAF